MGSDDGVFSINNAAASTTQAAATAQTNRRGTGGPLQFLAMAVCCACQKPSGRLAATRVVSAYRASTSLRLSCSSRQAGQAARCSRAAWAPRSSSSRSCSSVRCACMGSVLLELLPQRGQCASEVRFHRAHFERHRMRYLFERHLLGKPEDEGGALLCREPLHSRPDGLKLLANCELAFRRSTRVGQIVRSGRGGAALGLRRGEQTPP